MQAQKGQLKPEKDEEISSVSAEKIELTEDHFVSQALTFFFAGFDTVSTAASFMALELALNPQVQKKLQLEIDSVREKYEKIPYEVLQSMKYLDQVVSGNNRNILLRNFWFMYYRIGKNKCFLKVLFLHYLISCFP